MALLPSQIVRVNLIILLIISIATNVDCRSGHSRGRTGRFKISNLMKNRVHSNTINRQSSFLRKTNNHNLVRGAAGGGAAALVGTLALRSFVSNNNKAFIQSEHILTNGTGSLCINRENYSNFVFNEFYCPLSPIFATNDRYCCGFSQQQYCCSFWESGSRAIGVIAGIILACSLLILLLIFYRRHSKRKVLSLIEGKGFGGTRGGGGGGVKTGSRGSGTFNSGSNYNRGSNNAAMSKPRSGSSFKSNAMSFAAGAAGGVAAYALMRSMSGSYHSRPSGSYGSGYGVGETCTNNEDLNGTVFGQFRCPLYGFPQEAKYCCGEHGKQFCCIRERSSQFLHGRAHFGWIVLVIIILFVLILLWARRRRRQQKEMMMIPTEPPLNEYNQPPPFYHPPPPPMGYPPPPGNPYGVPPPNQPGNFNPYGQQPYMPYPPQPQPYNPY